MKTFANRLAEQYATHPVAMAVLPLRKAAQDMAEANERKDIEALLSELIQHDWYASMVAPHPNRMNSRLSYYADRRRYDLCNAITTWDKPTHGLNEHYRVHHDVNKTEMYVERIRCLAADDFDAFVYKLCGKIGQCDTAEFSNTIDEGVWQHSILTVTKSGGLEKWKTQVITKRSKFGRVFNQWPTRKLTLGKK
jgi:hypothetical protein